MAMTQWNDIVEVIGAIFTGVSAMLVLVVHLEQWLAGYSAHGCRWAGWVWPGVAQQVGQRRRGESSASSNACRDRAWSSVTSWWSRRALSNQSW